jgi:hypothetical protein
MAITDRVKNILASPNTEWPVIEQERTSPAELVTGYLAPLAAIGAVAGFIGSTVVGTTVPMVGTYRAPVVSALVAAVVAFALTIAGCFVISAIIDALAPTFGGRKDSNQAFKVAVYSYTPGLVAGVLQVLPMLGALVGLVAGLYGLYLLYLGLPVLMKSPQDKTLVYAVVVVVCAIVVMVVVGLVLGIFGGAASMIAG